MENTDKIRKKRENAGVDAEFAGDNSFDSMSSVSSTEATGLMYCPPRSEDELRSREQLFALQTDMSPEGYVGKEREWRADIENYLRDESKTPLRDTPIDFMGRREVLDPANTFIDPFDSEGV